MDIVSEAVNLVQRYQKGDAFRHHVEARSLQIAAVVVVFLGFSIALSLGAVGLIAKGGIRGFLGVLLMPIVLIGSLVVQIYVFFAWLELRALQPMLHANLPAKLGNVPPLPWTALAVFILLPFVSL